MSNKRSKFSFALMVYFDDQPSGYDSQLTYTLIKVLSLFAPPRPPPSGYMTLIMSHNPTGGPALPTSRTTSQCTLPPSNEFCPTVHT